MVQRFFAGWLGAWLLLLGMAFAAPKPAAQRDAFATALGNTRVGSDPAQAYFLVQLLKETRASGDDVEALRRELLHAYVEQLSGGPAPATGVAAAPARGVWAALRSHWPGGASAPHDTVNAAMARGRLRDSVPNAPLVVAWQAAFDKNMEVRWPPADGPRPYAVMQDRNLQPVARGVWATEAAHGQIQFLLALRLANKAALALPIDRPDIVWGGEPVTGRGGVSLACDWDGVRPPKGRAALDAVEMLAPGGESRALVCTSPPLGTYWKEQLPALVAQAQAQAQAGGARPLLVSHAFDTRQRLPHLEVALGNLSGQRADWVERLRRAQQEVGRQWRPAPQPLAAPVAQQWGVTPHDGWAAAGQKLQWFLGATLMALALWGAGRKALQWGWPSVGVGAATLLVAGGLWAVGVAKINGGGGMGYSSPLFTAIALGAWWSAPCCWACGCCMRCKTCWRASAWAGRSAWRGAGGAHSMGAATPRVPSSGPSSCSVCGCGHWPASAWCRWTAGWGRCC